MSKRRLNLGDMNMWHLAASSLRPRYYVDLHGLSLDECVAKTREMIDVAQDEWLAEYEIACCYRTPTHRACAVGSVDEAQSKDQEQNYRDAQDR